MRALIVLLLSLSACDVCDAASRIHVERCDDGNQEACEWLSVHIVGGECYLVPPGSP